MARRRKPGEGHVYQRKGGLWEWKAMMPNGERRSFYGKTEREARRKKNDALRDFDDGIQLGNERLTVGQYLDRWIEDTAADRVRPSTLASYQSHIKTHIKPSMGVYCSAR